MIKNLNKSKLHQQNNKAVLDEGVLLQDDPVLSLTEKLREKKKAKNKRIRKRAYWGAFVLFIIWFLYWGLMPYQGTIPYAMCKTMIELNVPYPHTLGFTEVAELRTGDIRIWFTHTDAFGAFRQEPFLCSFSFDKETNRPYLTKARWGVVDLEQKQIDLFNKALPFMVSAGYYDTTYPAPLPDSIEDMDLDIDRFRKVKIMDLVTGKQ